MKTENYWMKLELQLTYVFCHGNRGKDQIDVLDKLRKVWPQHKQPSPDAVLIVIAVLDCLETIMESLGTATAQFGFDLFKELDKTNDGNIFFSPVGISTAIGMIITGTGGATASELQKVRSFPWFSGRLGLGV